MSKTKFSAVDRLRAIAPMLKRYRRQSLDRIARQIAPKQGVSFGTVWNWYCKFKKLGYAALANSPRRDIGRSDYLWKHPEIEQLIRARLATGQSAFSIANSLFSDLGADAPSYSVVLKCAKYQYRPYEGTPSHTLTFGKNSPAMRAELAALGVLKVGERTAYPGHLLRQRLRAALSEYDIFKARASQNQTERL